MVFYQDKETPKLIVKTLLFSVTETTLETLKFDSSISHDLIGKGIGETFVTNRLITFEHVSETLHAMI